MTLGEKIKYARKCCGMSQEQLAGKLCVSRSAIAKWETDKGIPDVENLKMLSKLLGISVDALLDDSDRSQSPLIRCQYNLSAYGRGCKRVRKERMLQEKFTNAKICYLLGRPILTQEETSLDSTRGILTPTPFGMPEFMKSIKEQERDFYLIEQEDAPLFVSVTQEFVEIRLLAEIPEGKSFQIGGWTFIRLNYLTAE